MGTRAAASRTAAESAWEKPVEPITRAGPPRPAASLASAAEAWAEEKSITTSQSGRAADASPSTRSPTAWPTESGRSNRAASSSPSRASTSPAVTRPMRPSAPATAILIGLVCSIGRGP